MELIHLKEIAAVIVVLLIVLLVRKQKKTILYRTHVNVTMEPNLLILLERNVSGDLLVYTAEDGSLVIKLDKNVTFPIKLSAQKHPHRPQR